MENKKSLTPKEAAVFLGISVATVKNWIRLKKLPATKSGASFMIQKKDLLSLQKNMDRLQMLKSRRNKSRQRSNFIPKNYISKDSPNYRTICSLIDDFGESVPDTAAILSFYALRLMEQAGIPDFLAKELALFDCEIPDDSLFRDYPLTLVDGEDTLGMLYISLRRMQDKKSTGSYYTPYSVADLLIEKALFSHRDALSGLKLCDPSCGTGNFLIRLPKEIGPENIFGSDIDENAIALTRINLAIRFRIQAKKELDIIKNNVLVKDYLNAENSKDYDIIIGNPPWGYSYSQKEISRLKKGFITASGSSKPESFSLFLEKSLNYDEVTFLMPETLLGSDTHRSIREEIHNKTGIKSISYLGEVFDKVQCPCIILSLKKKAENTETNVDFYEKKAGKLVNTRDFTIPSNRLTSSSFHALASNEEFEILEKMQSCPHFTLKGQAEFALGIVTGNNKGLLFDHEIPGSEPIIKGTDIMKFALKEPANYIISDVSSFQQAAPQKLYRAQEKLVYKFICSRLCFALDDSGLLTLNSANILIPRVEGYSAAYIMAVLNSSSMAFYYSHAFRNFKVLRSALESLPIPTCSPEKMQEISHLTMELMNYIKENGKPDSNLVKKLDKMVANLYNLSTEC